MFAAPVYLSGVPPGRQSSLLATAAFFLGLAWRGRQVRHGPPLIVGGGDTGRGGALGGRERESARRPDGVGRVQGSATRRTVTERARRLRMAWRHRLRLAAGACSALLARAAPDTIRAAEGGPPKRARPAGRALGAVPSAYANRRVGNDARTKSPGQRTRRGRPARRRRP